MTGTIVGKYRVEERVGRGGMGTVYRAVDETLHREVAIKVLNSELDDPEVARRFRAEAITVARLNHPGIATIYELFEHDGQWLMVMEFVRGETLERLVQRGGPLTWERAVELCVQALTALSHAHDLGVVHRDLKLPNLMLTESGAVKIMDFGIARVSGAEHLTSVGFAMGTPAYMAPEQVLGHEVDARTDLYAMGVVLFRLLTAQLPFKGDTPFALANSHVHDAPTPVRLLRDGLPAWLEDLLTRVLAKAPTDRYQTAAELRDALQRRLAGSPTSRMSDSLAPVLKTPGPPSPVPAPTDVSTAETMLASPVLGVATALAPARAVEKPARAKSGPLTITIAAAVMVIAVVGALMWRKSPSASGAAGAPAPVSAAPVVPPSSPPPVTAPVSAKVVPPATDAREKPVAPSVAPAVPARGRAAARPSPAEDDALLVFGGAKWLTFDGRKGRDREVMLHFGSGQISVLPKDGGETLRAIPYRTIVRVGYSHTKNPLWDATLPGPPADADIPGFMRGARHWLVLQGKSSYTVVFLGDKNVEQVLRAVEARTGLQVSASSR